MVAYLHRDRADIGAGICRVVADSSAGYDIVGNDPKGDNRPCRELHVLGNAAMVIVDADGNSVTLPDAGQPWVFPVQAQSITAAGSSATNVIVIW